MKIKIDELSNFLYETNLKKKNYRVCNVIKSLLLRNDFQETLTLLKEKGHEEDLNLKGRLRNNAVIHKINFEFSGPLIEAFLEKIIRSKLTQNDPILKKNIEKIGHSLLMYAYTESYANQKSVNTLFHKTVNENNDMNYPNISNNIFVKDKFWEVFNEAFYKNNLGSDGPTAIMIGGSREDKYRKEQICQLVFDDTTEKQELIDYIDKEWKSITAILKPYGDTKNRMVSTKNFLRDVDIYNKFYEFKNEGIENSDGKVYSWLLKDSKYQIEVEPNTIRKIVSRLDTDIKSINS